MDRIWNTPASIFYADDGNLYSLCADTLQIATNHIVNLFSRMGLETNTAKTKAMISVPGQLVTRISSPAYQRMMGDTAEETHSDRKRRRVTCDICGNSMQAALDSSWSRYGNDQTGTTVVDAVILISLYLDRKDNIRIRSDI
jgi:hypothetical protein